MSVSVNPGHVRRNVPLTMLSVLFAALVLLADRGAPAVPAEKEVRQTEGAPAGCVGESCGAKITPVVVALALPLSGEHASLGREVQEVVQKALTSVGVTRIVQLDTAGTAAGAEKAVADAVRGGASLIVGGIGDRESAALSSAAESAGIRLVTMGRSVMPGPGTIQAVVSRRRMNETLLENVLKQGPVDCAWVIHLDNAFGQAEFSAFKWALEKRGIRLAGAGTPPAAGEDEVAYATGIVNQMKLKRESGVCTNEILHLIVDVGIAGRLVDHLWFAGYFDREGGSVRVTGTGLFNAPGLAAQHGSSLRGLIFVDLDVDMLFSSARPDIFMAEVDDFAAVAAGMASQMMRPGTGDGPQTPPSIAGRTGTLVFSDGVITGQRIRACRMTGRGLEYVPDDAASQVPPGGAGSAPSRSSQPAPAPATSPVPDKH